MFSQDPQNRARTGNPLADLILGDANSLTTGTKAAAIERGGYGGGYLQDQWTLTPTLTLNLGIRYELYVPYIETQNHMANFIFDRGDPIFGHLVLAGDPAKSRSLLTMDRNNLAPRVGLAWRVPFLKNTVIRSSYGIFYGQDQANGVVNRMIANPPFYGFGGVSITSDQLNPATGFVLSGGQLAPRPPAINPAQFVLNPAATTGLVSWNQRYTTPYVQEWNFTIEKQLPWNMVWETSYVGNIGIHLLGNYQANQPLTNGPGSPTTRRPLAQYTAATVLYFDPWDRSTYDGMSSHIEKRFNKGLSFVASFTYGHSLDLQNPALGVCDGCEAGNGIQNTYNRDNQKGPSDQNVPLRFVIAGIWDLPFGPGRAIASQGAVSHIVGNWQLSAIYQVQNGLPFTTILSFDNANAGNSSWPNRVCNGNISNPSVSQWYNTSCFVAPAQYQFGNEGRNVLTAPGRNNTDLAIHRSFKIPGREGVALEFRAEGVQSVQPSAIPVSRRHHRRGDGRRHQRHSRSQSPNAVGVPFSVLTGSMKTSIMPHTLNRRDFLGLMAGGLSLPPSPQPPGAPEHPLHHGGRSCRARHQRLRQPDQSDAQYRPHRQGGHAFRQLLLHQLHLHAQPRRHPDRPVQPHQRRQDPGRQPRSRAAERRQAAAGRRLPDRLSIGKWHLVNDPAGFDYWNILPGQGVYHNPVMHRDGPARRRIRATATDIIADYSLDWLKRRDKNKPFFLMCHHKAPHRPWEPDAETRAHVRRRDDPRAGQSATITTSTARKAAANATNEGRREHEQDAT